MAVFETKYVIFYLIFITTTRVESITSNEFVLDFYKVASSQNKEASLITSPFSAEIILGLLSLGAEGSSRNEIFNAIHMNNTDMIKFIYKSKMTSIKNINNAVLNIANKIYVKDGALFHLNNQFKNIAVDEFSSEVENINFSLKEKAAENINNWVEKRTNDKIKKLISSDSLDDDTYMIIINAIYFQGNWKYPFDKKFVFSEEFKINKTTRVNVDFMYQNNDFAYLDSPEWDSKILELPYKAKDISLIIILPNQVDGLANLEKELTWSGISRVLEQMTTKEVTVQIPKFKIETSLNLKEILPNLGIKKVFNSEEANLRGILENNYPLYVSEAKQKAFIEVNEVGTEAAATTYMKLSYRCADDEDNKKYFTANHPFFYMITHKNDIIFCGKYTGN